MKKNIVIVVLSIVVVCLGIVALNESARIDDCVHEIDDFRNYYDATETLLDSMDNENILDTYMETDCGSDYLSMRKHLGRTWKRNHGSSIDAQVIAVVHERK